MHSDHKARILIIDDDLGFCELLRMQLSAAGYEAQIAEDGVDGGRSLLANPPDLVISDVDMPFLGGLELLSLLRADEGTAAIPVIMLSGRSDIKTIAKAVEHGASDYLIKPVTQEDLLKAVKSGLERAQGKAPADDRPDDGPA